VHGLHGARQFIREELWDRDLTALPRMKKLLFTFCRVGTIVFKGLIADNCGLQSAALSYITLVSMVPVLALMFAVSKGFGAQAKVMEIIGGQLSELPEKSAEFIEQVFALVNNTNFGALGGIGLLLIFWTVIKMLGKVESTFNTIWGVPESRSTMRKFADYISVLVVVPILILASTSINTMLSSGSIAQLLEQKLGPLYVVYQRGISLTGLISLFAAFSLLYAFMPNTRVRLVPATIGGICGGFTWYAAQRVYIVLQVGVTKYNAIYGTFAAIPFFLTWLYMSWLIVLIGAEIAFAVQNHVTYLAESATADASVATRRLLGMVVVYEICQAFARDQQPWSVTEYGKTHNIPVRLLADVTYRLEQSHLVVPLDERRTSFVPAKDINLLTLADVEHAFIGAQNGLAEGLAKRQAAVILQRLAPELSRFSNSLGDIRFRDLLNQNDDERAISVDG